MRALAPLPGRIRLCSTTHGSTFQNVPTNISELRPHFPLILTLWPSLGSRMHHSVFLNVLASVLEQQTAMFMLPL